MVPSAWHVPSRDRASCSASVKPMAFLSHFISQSRSSSCCKNPCSTGISLQWASRSSCRWHSRETASVCRSFRIFFPSSRSAFASSRFSGSVQVLVTRGKEAKDRALSRAAHRSGSSSVHAFCSRVSCSCSVIRNAVSFSWFTSADRRIASSSRWMHAAMVCPRLSRYMWTKVSFRYCSVSCSIRCKPKGSPMTHRYSSVSRFSSSASVRPLKRSHRSCISPCRAGSAYHASMMSASPRLTIMFISVSSRIRKVGVMSSSAQ